MADYSKGEVYKSSSGGTVGIYIGSTTQKLNKRLADHKCKASSEKGKYCSSRPLFEKGNVKITLPGDHPSERKEQLLARERHWVETLPNINCKIPSRTSKENHSEKNVCDKCGPELAKYTMGRHQRRSLCQAVAEMRPTRKRTKEM